MRLRGRVDWVPRSAFLTRQQGENPEASPVEACVICDRVFFAVESTSILYQESINIKPVKSVPKSRQTAGWFSQL
jgi:hypothetical protein